MAMSGNRVTLSFPEKWQLQCLGQLFQAQQTEFQNVSSLKSDGWEGNKLQTDVDEVLFAGAQKLSEQSTPALIKKTLQLQQLLAMNYSENV